MVHTILRLLYTDIDLPRTAACHITITGNECICAYSRDYESYLILLCPGVAVGGGAVNVAVTMDTVPVYLRGGYIVPRKERPRRSTAAMDADPLTLVWPPLLSKITILGRQFCHPGCASTSDFMLA